MPLRERIGRYIDACPPAISGQNGHDQTFRVACILVQGFDLSPDDAYSFLSRYNERCEPPWNERTAPQTPRRRPSAQLQTERLPFMNNEINLEESGRICGKLQRQFIKIIGVRPWSKEWAAGAFHALVRAAVMVSGSQCGWCREIVVQTMVTATNEAINHLQSWKEIDQDETSQS